MALVIASAWAGMNVATAQPGGGPPPARVSIDPVRLETIEPRREVTGEIRAVRQASLAAQEGGLVIDFTVDAGEWVEQGTVIARLDDGLRTLDVSRRLAELRSAEATVEERKAQVAKAERDLSRLQELERSAGASQNEVDDAGTRLKEEQARLAQALAMVESANAEHETASKRLRDMTITAPFAGSIVRKRVEIGEWVSEGDALVDVVAIDAVDVYLDVPERFTGPLSAPGAVVMLKIPALEREIESKVTTVLSAGDRLARTFPARIRLENKAGAAGDGMLRPGMSVVGLVPTGESAEALTIHKDAVLRNSAGSYVYFDGGGTAQVAPIEVLHAAGERVVVRSPVLKPGMGVLVEGNERVFPSQPLMIQNGAGAPPAADASKDTEKGG